MKSFIALTVGLVGIGSEATFSDLAFGAPATIQSYLFSLPEPGIVEMLLGGGSRADAFCGISQEATDRPIARNFSHESVCNGPLLNPGNRSAQPEA